ncbi:RDD family protein [Kitasatospora acidiphila]|uniref:RDD family protein n=1 Tax=Kitasatospora acidiphila TaxID=2567942 RepID=A0A540W7T1_9ACTN|nr:RDD family protein [Kitasatospora acidiphila]TQF05082.1 RDD family protein [Kitasatospora acidiphila]
MSNPYQPNLDPNYAYTPQPPAPVLAGWPLRFASGLIDFVITAVLAGIASLASQGLGYVVELIVLIVFGVLEGTRAQTPGKMVVGLRTVQLADGSLLGAGLGIGRRLLHILDAIACFVGYLWPLWDEKRQTFADKIVKSVVVKVQ